MDGTLVDSMPYWQNCGIEYLQSKGLQPEPGLWDRLALMSTGECAAYFIEHYGLTDPPEKIVAENNHIMYEHYRLRIPAKPGVPEYLAKLKAHGVTISVCSATAIPLVEMTLSRLGLRDFFSFLTSCDEVNRGKDRPDVFELAISRLGAVPQECVMYEDSDFGIRTAKSIGMRVAGVYDPSCLTESDIVRSWCDCYIVDYTKLDFFPQEG